MMLYRPVVGSYSSSQKQKGGAKMIALRSIAAAIALTVLAAAPAGAQATKINVGYANASEFIPAFVAKDKGLFAKHDLDVTLTSIPLSTTIPAALVSQSMQIGIGSPTGILIAAEGGLDLVAICASNRLIPSNQRIGLLTRPGFTVNSANDLKGKKIGIPGFYSSIEVMFRKWALDKGLPPEQMTLVEVALPQMADVLKSGSVDAVTAIEPILTRIAASGAGNKSVDYVSELTPDTLGALWMATRAWTTANRDAVRRFVAAYEEAIAFVQQNPEEAHQIEIKYLGFAGKSFPTFSTEIKAADLEFYAGMMRELKILKQPVDAAKLVLN
jgi:NitT/TauT family transport system substrate-binding protein